MKMQHGLILAATLAVSGAAFAASDGSYSYPSDRYAMGTNSVHSGGMTYEDQLLADRIAAAIAADRQLSEPGITATVVANNGRVSLNGSAKDVTQAARAEKIASDIAGRANVSGTLDSQPG